MHILQGERAEARYNRTLRKFHLDGILPAPRGVPKIEVAFDIDANGILSVHAKDTVTGKDQKIKIEASSGLNEQEIQKMVAEAAAHEADDKVRREMIGEHKEKLPAADVSTLEGLIKEGREAVEKQDDGKITELSAKLEAEMQRVASTMYQAAGAAGGPGAPPGAGDGAPNGDGAQNGGPEPGKKEGGVIDAEFEETQQ